MRVEKRLNVEHCDNPTGVCPVSDQNTPFYI